ncbi:hypothetical protein QVD17_23660 [Tagetes erecta]|uniref:Nucleotide-diphospho-sugar transferase domain-containing protein n=1 Tax=Tagetes erecta TaxID=13708 RepID=A0AAD8KKQ3_TARER|nr:hypothetical protein QVD17_23660 [Tagetes erecta]
MDQPNKPATPIALCTLLLISLLLIYLLSETNSPVSITAIHNTSMYKDELEAALEGASMGNKTVIITIVNRAYTEGDKPMLDIFLDGLWLGEDTRQLTNHLLIVAVDQTAFERCQFLRLHCYKMKTDGDEFVDEKTYMSEDFIKMMWQRTRFLGDVLRRGYNFVFTDTDVMWLRNPMSRLSLNETVDLQISVDVFNGNQWSQRNPLNTGFYMIKSNNKTIALFDKWYGQRNYSSGKKEQDVLVELMHKRAFKRLKLKVRFLDTKYFSGFCQNSKDVNVVSTVHANCCRSISAKVTDLITVLHDWKRFRDLSGNKTMGDHRWSDHSACINSWIS